MLLLTVFLLFLLVLLSYFLFERDLFAPPTIVALGFLFSSLCALYNESKWALEFSGKTTWTIFVGVFSFIIGGMIALLISSIRTGHIGFNRTISEIRPIRIEYTKTFLVLIFQLITFLYLFHEIKRITGETTWTKMVLVYRDLTDFDQDLNDTSIILPWLLRQFLEMNFAFGLAYVYIIGNNLAAKFNNKLDWVPVILTTIITFLQGYRSDMLRLWIALLIVLYVSKKRSVGWVHDKESKRIVRKLGLSVVGIAVLFVALRSTVGRSETDWDPVFYFSHYAGSPVAAFDLFIKNPPSPSTIWGKETFYNLNQIIAKWFNKPELKYIFYKEFRSSPSKYLIGNIYTALRPPYYDFGGITGMAVYMIVFGAFFTGIYCYVHKRHGTSEIDFSLFLYSYLAYTFFLYFYNLYNNFISLGFPKLIIELLLVRWFLVGWHFDRSVQLTFKH